MGKQIKIGCNSVEVSEKPAEFAIEMHCGFGVAVRVSAHFLCRDVNQESLIGAKWRQFWQIVRVFLEALQDWLSCWSAR